MRIVFAGTGAFSLPSLQTIFKLCQATTSHQLVGVYTQPDRPSGRGQVNTASPIKKWAQSNQLPIYQPPTFKKEEIRNELAVLQPDLMVVVAYGLLLPPSVLSIPVLGCINVHASLLPRWRGAAPIQRALLAGDQETGITIMQMDAGLDTGPILYHIKEPILSHDTAATLENRLAIKGGEALKIVLAESMQPIAQPKQGSCYAKKLAKQEGVINWALPAIQLDRQVRGLNPWPVAFSWLDGVKYRIWEATCLTEQTTEMVTSKPGEVMEIAKHGITVATGEGYLMLQSLQREGGRRLPVSDLLNGSLSFLKTGMFFHP